MIEFHVVSNYPLCSVVSFTCCAEVQSLEEIYEHEQRGGTVFTSWHPFVGPGPCSQFTWFCCFGVGHACSSTGYIMGAQLCAVLHLVVLVSILQNPIIGWDYACGSPGSDLLCWQCSELTWLYSCLFSCIPLWGHAHHGAGLHITESCHGDSTTLTWCQYLDAVHLMELVSLFSTFIKYIDVCNSLYRLFLSTFMTRIIFTS